MEQTRNKFKQICLINVTLGKIIKILVKNVTNRAQWLVIVTMLLYHIDQKSLLIYE